MPSPLTLSIQSFLVLCILFFAAVFYTSSKTIVERRTAAWLQTPGVVIASRVITRQSQDGTGYCPQIVVAYEVKQQNYEITSANREGKCSRDESRAKKFASLYPAGAEITVFYTAENPAAGVLYTGVAWITYFGAALSLIVCFACVLLARLLWKKPA